MLQSLDVQLISVLCVLVHLVLDILLDHLLDCLNHRLVPQDVVLHPQPLLVIGFEGLLEEELFLHLIVVAVAHLSVVETVLEVKHLRRAEEMPLQQLELLDHVVRQRGLLLLPREVLVELLEYLAGGELQFLQHGQKLVVIADVHPEVEELDVIDGLAHLTLRVDVDHIEVIHIGRISHRIQKSERGELAISALAAKRAFIFSQCSSTMCWLSSSMYLLLEARTDFSRVLWRISASKMLMSR